MGARAERAPFSLLLPVPGGERSFAVQYLSLMQARCCPLSQRGHFVAGESSKCAHLLGRVRRRLFTYALNLLLPTDTGRAHAREHDQSGSVGGKVAHSDHGVG